MALSALERNKPFDLILMDVQMPVMDGFAATLELRSKGYRGPVIALTANAMDRDKSKCLSAGCNDFVTKPIKMELLIKAIGKYLKVVDTSKEQATGADTAKRAVLAQKFNQELPTEIAQLEEAVERQDRQQLKDVAKLVLGKAAAAGLKDIAPAAAKLLMAAENEQSWTTLSKTITDFAAECAPSTARQAA